MDAMVVGVNVGVVPVRMLLMKLASENCEKREERNSGESVGSDTGLLGSTSGETAPDDDDNGEWGWAAIVLTGGLQQRALYYTTTTTTTDGVRRRLRRLLLLLLPPLLLLLLLPGEGWGCNGWCW